MKIKQENTVYVIIGIVALIVGFLLGIWWKNYSISNATKSNYEQMGAASTSTVTALSPQKASVYVASQKAGSSVTVDSVSVSSPSWVVITEDIDGKQARILGAQKVIPGEAKTQVDLLRATVAGQTYHGIIYADDGDSQFDYKVDAPLQDSTGAIVESVFKAS